MYNQTRGLRLNNPGNIERAIGVTWHGQAAIQPDERFVTFSRPEDGIRALRITLHTYLTVHGLDTLDRMISRYAPSNENDTEAYIDDVSRQTGIPRTQRLSVADISSLVPAIIRHEQGFVPYSAGTLAAGLALA